ncbi:MAG: hypothetical protein M1820_005846 [Bogoriella megaspora]|nr:MAG: hypothetical protein M1820_005846 [Bogoriella megaspora]
MNLNSFKFLRPHTLKTCSSHRKHAYTSFFYAFHTAVRRSTKAVATDSPHDGSLDDSQKRIEKLKSIDDVSNVYPRVKREKDIWSQPSLSRLRTDYNDLTIGEVKEDAKTTVKGRIQSIRTSGSKLRFYDVTDGTTHLQVMSNLGRIVNDGTLNEDERGKVKESWKRAGQILRKGDWALFTGYPSRTTSGELSISTTEVPELLAPSLHQVPEELTDPETRSRSPHVDMIVNQRPRDILRIRHHVEKYICDELTARGLIQVRTPMLSSNSGGATARPFTTLSTEAPDIELKLRVAPELFLKRLLVGNMGEGVFEIGQAFRNEGIDATHNPEFTICEFYKPFATIDDLIELTEDLVSGLADHTRKLRTQTTHPLDEIDLEFKSPFRRIELIPAIQAAIGLELPDLISSGAQQQLLILFNRLNLIPPDKPSVPRLLDALCSKFIEPQCQAPTFIINPPECLSPLAKSFIDIKTGQKVGARAELFIKGREYANMYEEENSPFEQRKKFEEQVRHRNIDKEDGEGVNAIDENYISALEWGLPPTGGWGCGVDRLCMLFSGTDRISDVLPFGTLRNVVSLAQPPRR